MKKIITAGIDLAKNVFAVQQWTSKACAPAVKLLELCPLTSLPD